MHGAITTHFPPIPELAISPIGVYGGAHVAVTYAGIASLVGHAPAASYPVVALNTTCVMRPDLSLFCGEQLAAQNYELIEGIARLGPCAPAMARVAFRAKGPSGQAKDRGHDAGFPHRFDHFEHREA